MVAQLLLLSIQTAFSQPAESEYQHLIVEGFPVLVSPNSQTQTKLIRPTLDLLAFRLRQVEQEVPKSALTRLRSVRFWIEANDPITPAMVYHPDPGWLRAHGYNPAMAGCVEIGNLKNFLAWQHIQPSMVLHELSHAFHFQVLGELPAINKAFESAVAGKKYESVLFVTGGHRRAYALTNKYEYFAECSEAYFGRNDFYPFIRSELKSFDPQGYAAVETAWKIKP
jgi:hypothetical protein